MFKNENYKLLKFNLMKKNNLLKKFFKKIDDLLEVFLLQLQNEKMNQDKVNESEVKAVIKAEKRLIKAFIIAATMVGFIFLITKELQYRCSRVGRSFSQPTPLTDSLYFNSFYNRRLHKDYLVGYKGYKYVLFNPERKPILYAERFFYKENPTTEDSLFVYSKEGYRGFFNLNSEKDEISASDKRFLKAWFFDNKSGLAAVQDAKSQKIGFINPEGYYVIPPRYKYVKGTDYTFDNGECIVHEEDGSCTLIDSKGTTILKGFNEISNIIDGHRILKQNDKIGLWKDSLVLPVEFDDICLNNTKIQLTQGNRCWSIGYDYKTIIDPFIFDYINSITYEFQSKFTATHTPPQYCNSSKLKDLIICGFNNYEGVFNVKQQKMVVPIEWDCIEVLKYAEDEYALFGKKDDKYMLLKW